MGEVPRTSAPPTPLDCILPGDSKCETWTATTNSKEYDQTLGVAASPDGTRVFATGIEKPSPSNANDFVVVAHDQAGSLLWTARYGGPAQKQDFPFELIVSPDGKTVYVAGGQDGWNPSKGESDYALVALNAATGALRWASRYDSGRYDQAIDLTVSQDGEHIYVTGLSKGPGGQSDYDHLAVAFAAADGAVEWATLSGAPGEGYDYSFAVAVSPDGKTVATTGWWQAHPRGFGYGTIAYDARTGERKWLSILGGAENTSSSGWDVAFSPDSQLLYATGATALPPGTPHTRGGTVAYDVETGEEVWVEKISACQPCLTLQLAVGSDGTLYVGGDSYPFRTGGQSGYHLDLMAMALDGEDGERRWRTSYDLLEQNQFLGQLALSPNGQHVYLSGLSQHMSNYNLITTVGLNASTGAFRWDAMYGPPSTMLRFAASAPHLAAGGSRAFVGHALFDDANAYQSDFFVAAYDA